MRKIILFTVVLVSVLVNAQNAIQEFNFNATLNNTSNTISFLGDAKYVKDRNGMVNGALRISNNVLEASIPNLPLTNARRTVSIWVKYNDITAANYIWGYGSLANAQYFGLLQQSTAASRSDLNLAGWGPANDVIVTTSIASDTWYNYTVTYDGLTSKIYKNGELIKSSISPRKVTSSVVFGIGKMGSAVSMNADIDDLKIYDVALSSEEVAALYNSSQVLAPNENLFGDKVSAVAKTPKKALVRKTPAASNSNSATSALKEIEVPRISEIYSAQGIKVFTGNKKDIDISSLPEGTYLLKITNVLQDSVSKKLTSN